MNSGGSNHEEPQDPSCSLDEWEILEASTRKQILERLDRWKNENQRIAAIFANRKRRRTTTIASIG
jgi:hypothetical protein